MIGPSLLASLPALPGIRVAADSSGNVYLAGTFQNSAILGSTTLTSAGDDDVFVARLGSSGSFASAVRAGGASLTPSGYDDAFVWGVTPWRRRHGPAGEAG